MSMLKDLWAKLFAGSGGDRHPAEADPVEHQGYTIRPAPFAAEGQYQVAGTIEKEFDGAVKRHGFIRADRIAGREEAVQFTILKARQLIDQQGDRIFEEN